MTYAYRAPSHPGMGYPGFVDPKPPARFRVPSEGDGPRPDPSAIPRVDDQLVRPETREELVRGRAIFAVPALEPHADRHHALKERQGYSKLEIAEKRDALENVLIPLRVNENIALLEDAGFRPVSIFFKCYNFASFIALKA